MTKTSFNILKNKTVFEISWEVCNKVGGIFTVVSSKAALIKQNLKNYFLIGPYFEKHTKAHFTKETPPSFLESFCSTVKKHGLDCHFGHWLIAGEPKVILLDHQKKIPETNLIKKFLYQEFGIDSFQSQKDFDEAVCWSYSVGLLLNIFAQKNSGKMLVHGHEWHSGPALLMVKKSFPKVPTVFTTHATILGRSLANSNKPIHDILDKVKPLQEAYKYGIQAKFLTEKLTTNTVDIFTTVSKTTALEATKLLDRKPDVIVPNGLDINQFPTFEEISVQHRVFRDRIRNFLSYYFFPYYSFNLLHNLIFFIVGRYEYKNKGLDIFIKALGKLNNLMKKQNHSQRTISVFFWIPKKHKGNIKEEIHENKSGFEHVKDLLDANKDEIYKNIFNALLEYENLTKKSIFPAGFLERISKDILVFKKKNNPPLTTHDFEDANDPIMKAFVKNGLLNRAEDKVKVIFFPVYLDGHDGLLGLNYYQAILGCHLGIFPSYYEPWGYTPLEAAILGTPSITSDLAGFGKFIQEQFPDEKNTGIFVLKRSKKTETQIVKDLAEILYKFSNLTHRQRVTIKIKAQEQALLADWRYLIKNYFQAYILACRKFS